MKVKLLFIFALLLTAVTGARADDDSGSCGTDVSYSYVESTHTLTISGTGAMADYDDPSERPWDSYVEEIETIVIEDGVTGIGSRAFEGCSGLTTVTIGSGVTYIGYDAFFNCTKVEIVYCNADPEELMWDEAGCDDFKRDGSTIIHVADADSWYTKFGSVVHGIFRDPSTVPLTWNYDAGTKTLTFSGTEAIPSYNNPDKRPWKDYVEVVENIVIEDGVTRIGDDAFGYCASLTTVTIPASVKSVGSYAFEDCYSLTTVTIPASVTSIGHSAFYACESLTSVIVDASNCALGDCAFDECDNLEGIYVPSDKVEYYKAAENWSTYADKITAFIGGDCGAEGHETDVTWLLKGTSPNYTLTISGTGAMADYDAPSGQPWKDYRSSITSVVIESGVTSIGKNAFNNCTGLTSATVDAPDCTLGNGAFEGCSKLKAIYVPSDLVDHYKTAWSAYASIITEKIISQGYCGAEGHEEDVTWVLKNTSHNYTLTISGTGAMADYNNPSKRPWYSYVNGIETIVIEDGVTSIGVDAFFNCSGLTAVTIPASVTSIGDYAFNYCSNIATMTVEADNKVYDSRNSCNAIIEKETNTLIAGCKNTIIPDDVTRIGDFAFQGCSGLTTVTIPAGVTYIGRDAFYDCTAVTDVHCNADPEKLTWDEVGCDDFKEDGSTIIHVADAAPWYTKFGGEVHGIFRDPFTVPFSWNYDAGTKTLTFSGTEAIPSCNAPDERPWKDYVSEVENIVINEGVRGIGDYAFNYCSGLTTITIPASVTSIGKFAFNYCSGLTNVTIPASVTSIGYAPFAGCSNLATMTVDAGNTKYDSRNGCNAIIEKESNTLIAGCKNTIIPDDVTNIDNSAFEGCISLTTVTIPAGVTSIGGHAFSGCSGLTTVTIPAGVTSIGDNAFYGCSGLTTVTIGSGVTYIGYDAFYNCTNVEVVYCNANPEELTWDESGCDDFKSDGSTTIKVADAAPWIAKFTGKVNGIFSDKPYVPFTWNYDAGTKTLTFSGTAIPSYNDPDERPWKDYVSEVEKIVISDDVTSIGSRAFEGCSDLTTVTIPASVKSIGDEAFFNCSGLTAVTIPASVTSIGYGVFQNCSNLSTMTVETGNKAYDSRNSCNAIIEKESNTLIAGCKNTIIPDDVTNIDNNAFEGCISLTTVTIPAGVTSIGDNAFYGCSGLTTVTIGSGVTYIGYDAFYNCTAVTDIYCYADPDALMWDEYGCNDFMDEKATECHVTDQDLSLWSEKFGSEVNVTFKGDLAPQAETKDAGEEYWSSYYNSATHLKADNNTTVYKATLSGTTVTLTEITDQVINAGQAVLLKKTTADPVELTPCADASTDDYSGNDLEGVDAETAKESGSDYYVLSYKDSKLSFYKYSGTTLGANKAFFKIPANSSREFLDILGEVTGIDGRCKMEDGRSDVYYDLNGRRVMNPTKKGVYINNGHKVVVK